ncbi:MAG: FGGY family carbohydrate kinase, partial [Pseudomonadota bacterium]|nr:FGGY family carbohydrate kinase [Pseudomonadota bacterium]
MHDPTFQTWLSSVAEGILAKCNEIVMTAKSKTFELADMSNAFLLAIDQGTSSTRAMVFEPCGIALAAAQRELSQIFPRPGWVEHDPDVIWRDTEA